MWAGGNQPAEERDAAENVTRRFYPQGEQAGTVKYFYTKDHLGSIREVLGANGTVVSSSRYDVWGVRTTQGAQDAASFGFTGHMEHKELGLVFTLYRAYDPVTGRWLSRDPIGEDGGINLYGYVSNNPINFRDPLGLSPAGAAQDFLDQYNNMREANWKNSDKYFHCMANCNAAKRGKSGYDTAKALSEAREWFDENVKRDSKEACDADRQANDHGREAGKNDEDCKSACEKYRPAGLPSKY